MTASMRERFAAVASRLLDEDPRVAIVLADIGAARFEATGAARRHPQRVVNVGIREQLMIGVAAGMALEGMRPIVHSYAPFLVERPWEMIKLDLGHQDVAAILVSIGASYDAAGEGRTHQAPEDVALLATLPGWHIDVPGHPDEVELLLRAAVQSGERTYIRLSDEANREPAAVAGGSMIAVRRWPSPLAVVVAVGPTLDPVLEATVGLPVTVLYSATVRPFDAATLRSELDAALSVVLVEPYLAWTSAGEIGRALADTPHRLLAIGIGDTELRRYGTAAEHRAAHGLDARGIRRSIAGFLAVA